MRSYVTLVVFVARKLRAYPRSRAAHTPDARGADRVLPGVLPPKRKELSRRGAERREYPAPGLLDGIRQFGVPDGPPQCID